MAGGTATVMGKKPKVTAAKAAKPKGAAAPVEADGDLAFKLTPLVMAAISGGPLKEAWDGLEAAQRKGIQDRVRNTIRRTHPGG